MLQIVLLAALVSSVVCADVHNNLVKIQYEVIQRESNLTHDALQNITNEAPTSKTRLQKMAKEFVAGVSDATFALQAIIANFQTTKEYPLLSDVSTILTIVTDSIEDAMKGTFDELKEELIVSLEKIRNGAHALEDIFESVPTDMVRRVHLHRKNDHFIHPIYKLKYQALLFNKSNKELKSEIVSGANNCIAILKKVPENEKRAEHQLRQLLYRASLTTERIVYKLTRWSDLNKNDTENVETVKEVSVVFGRLYGDQIGAAVEVKLDVPKLKSDLINIYETSTPEVVKLTDIEYDNKTSGEEYLRNTLLDYITIVGETSDILTAGY